MDTPTEETQYTKNTPAQDGPKKKKTTRKKAEPKAGKNDIEPFEIATDLVQDMDYEVIQHVSKLEQELATAKKKLKTQRKKFRQLLYGLAKHLDAKGITPYEVDQYIKGINPDRAEASNLDEEYEKFYSTYKYQIVDENMQQNGTTNGDSHGPDTKKTASKSSTNMLKDKDIPNPDQAVDASLTEGSKPQKAGRPKKDPAEKAQQKAANANGEEPKKRKSKKQKEGESGPELTEIPALDAAPVKGKRDEKINMGNGDSLTIPALSEDKGLKIPNLDPSGLMNAYMLGGGGHGLGLGIPGFPGMGGIPGMGMLSENDMAMYGKALQELMKGGGLNQFLGSNQSTKDLLGYFPSNQK